MFMNPIFGIYNPFWPFLTQFRGLFFPMTHHPDDTPVELWIYTIHKYNELCIWTFIRPFYWNLRSWTKKHGWDNFSRRTYYVISSHDLKNWFFEILNMTYCIFGIVGENKIIDIRSVSKLSYDHDGFTCTISKKFNSVPDFTVSPYPLQIRNPCQHKTVNKYT